jgi:sulfur carrier protein
VKVTVNGRCWELGAGTTLDELVSQAAPHGPKGTAVALNGEVVPKARWGSIRLQPDDRVEVLNAIGGG